MLIMKGSIADTVVPTQISKNHPARFVESLQGERPYKNSPHTRCFRCDTSAKVFDILLSHFQEGCIMKYAVSIALIFVAAFFFLPEPGSTAIRNLPLLILIVGLVFLSFCVYLFRLVVLIWKTRRLCLKGDAAIRRVRLAPGKSYLIAAHGDETFVIRFLIRKRSYYHYHFTDVNRVEYFKSSRAVCRANKVTGEVRIGAVNTRLVGHKNLRPLNISQDGKTTEILLMNKFPQRISDSMHKYLENGDRICHSEIRLYNYAGFSKFWNNRNSSDR